MGKGCGGRVAARAEGAPLWPTRDGSCTVRSAVPGARTTSCEDSPWVGWAGGAILWVEGREGHLVARGAHERRRRRGRLARPVAVRSVLRRFPPLAVKRRGQPLLRTLLRRGGRVLGAGAAARTRAVGQRVGRTCCGSVAPMRKCGSPASPCSVQFMSHRVPSGSARACMQGRVGRAAPNLPAARLDGSTLAGVPAPWRRC